MSSKRDRLLAIEVHEATRAFTLRAKLEDLDPEVVPGLGDTWQVRVAASDTGRELHEALARTREWLADEGLATATVLIAGARQVVRPDV